MLPHERQQQEDIQCDSMENFVFSGLSKYKHTITSKFVNGENPELIPV